MSDDWKIGDLAVCVDDAPCRCGECGGAKIPGLRIGCSYRVTGVNVPEGRLETDRPPSQHPLHLGMRWCNIGRFRKIRPDEHTPCEEEFRTLLKRRKVAA